MDHFQDQEAPEIFHEDLPITLKQKQGSGPSPEGNPEILLRNGTFISLVFQSRAKSGMPGKERPTISGRKNKKTHILAGTCRMTWCFDCDMSIHSSLLSPPLGHTSLHTQCTPEVASYLDTPLQQTREMKQTKQRVQTPVKGPV